MSWEKNMMLYSKTKEKGACPDCGSQHVKIESFQMDNHLSFTFICEDCKSFDHFDGRVNE